MKIYDGRQSFYQWDLNQKLVSDFKVGEEVHFHNIRQSTALVVVAYEYEDSIVVDVPNILLQNSYPIVVYRCAVNDTMLSTVQEQIFEVEQRPKPDDYVYTETEVLTITSVVNRAIKEAVASGDFKGEKGEPGEDGKDGKDGKDGQNGIDGIDGYTPQKGVDYWTDSDIEEIKSYVDEAILGGAW